MKYVVLLIEIGLLAMHLAISEGVLNAAEGINKPIILRENGITPLAAVIEIATANNIPIGIVFGTNPILCSETRSLNINEVNVTAALNKALSGSGYTVTNENDVYVLTAPDLTASEVRLLNYRFDRFSATNSDFSDAGGLLSGYIMTVAEGAQGFATDTISDPSSERFDIVMTASTTKEIANRIVSLKTKGIWVFRPTESRIPIPGEDTPVYIYGYKENAEALQHLTCPREFVK